MEKSFIDFIASLDAGARFISNNQKAINEMKDMKEDTFVPLVSMIIDEYCRENGFSSVKMCKTILELQKMVDKEES